MAAISTRAKSPTRAEAIAKALVPGPEYGTGVLIGNWVEERIECPKGGTLYFPPKDDIDFNKMKRESRQPDFRINRLCSSQGNVVSIIRHSSHEKCGNYATTKDLVYNHLPKPLCGPILRHYKRSAHQYYPQPDLMKCFADNAYATLRMLCIHGRRDCLTSRRSSARMSSFPLKKCQQAYTRVADSLSAFCTIGHWGNVTEWGLRNYLQQEWACSDVADYLSTLYEDTYVAPRPSQYLQEPDRKARNSSFTKTFRYKMTKPKQKMKQ